MSVLWHSTEFSEIWKHIFMIEDDDDEIAFIKEEARHQLNDRYFK